MPDIWTPWSKPGQGAPDSDTGNEEVVPPPASPSSMGFPSTLETFWPLAAFVFVLGVMYIYRVVLQDVVAFLGTEIGSLIIPPQGGTHGHVVFTPTYNPDCGIPKGASLAFTYPQDANVSVAFRPPHNGNAYFDMIDHNNKRMISYTAAFTPQTFLAAAEVPYPNPSRFIGPAPPPGDGYGDGGSGSAQGPDSQSPNDGFYALPRFCNYTQGQRSQNQPQRQPEQDRFSYRPVLRSQPQFRPQPAPRGPPQPQPPNSSWTYQSGSQSQPQSFTSASQSPTFRHGPFTLANNSPPPKQTEFTQFLASQGKLPSPQENEASRNMTVQRQGQNQAPQHLRNRRTNAYGADY